MSVGIVVVLVDALHRTCAGRSGYLMKITDASVSMHLEAIAIVVSQ